MSTIATAEIEQISRAEYGWAVAVLVRAFGDIDGTPNRPYKRRNSEINSRVAVVLKKRLRIVWSTDDPGPLAFPRKLENHRGRSVSGVDPVRSCLSR